MKDLGRSVFARNLRFDIRGCYLEAAEEYQPFQSEERNRTALIAIPRTGNDAHFADGGSCVEPYSTSYRGQLE